MSRSMKYRAVIKCNNNLEFEVFDWCYAQFDFPAISKNRWEWEAYTWDSYLFGFSDAKDFAWFMLKFGGDRCSIMN